LVHNRAKIPSRIRGDKKSSVRGHENARVGSAFLVNGGGSSGINPQRAKAIPVAMGPGWHFPEKWP